MGFLKRIAGMLGGGGSASGGAGSHDPTGVPLYFRCAQCDEVVHIRVDKRNDFNREDGGPGALMLRKEVMGNKCFQLLHATVWVSNSYDVVSADVVGGELATAEEYEAYRNPPPPGLADSADEGPE